MLESEKLFVGEKYLFRLSDNGKVKKKNNKKGIAVQFKQENKSNKPLFKLTFQPTIVLTTQL